MRIVVGLSSSCAWDQARSTGSHCGGHARGCSTSASLLATLGLVMCGMKAVKKAAATPMRKSAWKREACPFAYMLLRRLAVQVAVQNRQCTILFCIDSLSCTGGIAAWAGTVQDRLSWRDGEDVRRACFLSLPQSAVFETVVRTWFFESPGRFRWL